MSEAAGRRQPLIKPKPTHDHMAKSGEECRSIVKRLIGRFLPQTPDDIKPASSMALRQASDARLRTRRRKPWILPD
jgi:hypothetical protein